MLYIKDDWIVNKVIRYYRRFKNIVSLFIDSKEYLEKGEYILDRNLRYIYKNEIDTIEFINKEFLENNNYWKIKGNFKNLIKKFFTANKIWVQNDLDKGKFQGSFYLLTATNTEDMNVKVFDIKGNKILTEFSNFKSFEKMISDYNYFKHFFNIPSILHYNSDKRITIEELIESKTKNTWSYGDYKKIIDYIFNSYIEYYKATITKKPLEFSTVSNILYKLNKDGVLKNLACQIESVIAEDLILKKIPIIYQHGDLNLHNIILGKDGIMYFIDWNTSGDYFIFLLESLYNRTLNRNLNKKVARKKEYERLFNNVEKELGLA